MLNILSNIYKILIINELQNIIFFNQLFFRKVTEILYKVIESKLFRRMKSVIFFTCLIMSFCATCQSDSTYANMIMYEKYLVNQENYNEVRHLLREEKFENAIAILEKITCNGILCKSKNVYLAIAYASLNQLTKAEISLRNAVSQGYELKYLTKDIYKPIVEKNNFSKFWQQYEDTIDTTLRKELIAMTKEDQRYRKSFNKARISKDTFKTDSLGTLINKIDSVNLVRLHTIVNENGWPGISLVGHSVMFSDPDATLLVMHAPEKDNIFFYKYIYDACLKGKEEWYAAESVMQNMLMRFESKSYPYHKLRYVYVENGKLNISKSSFQLKILSKVLRGHPHISIKLYQVNNQASNILEDVNTFLLKEGVPPNQISMSDILAPYEQDDLGNYQIVFTRTYHHQNK